MMKFVRQPLCMQPTMLSRAPKELFLVPETGHWTYPEQNEKLTNWLVGKLKGK